MDHFEDVAPPAYVTLGAVHLKKRPKRGKRERVKVDESTVGDLLRDFTAFGGSVH